MERKCFGDVTNQNSATSGAATRQNISSTFNLMVQLEENIVALNDRLDVLSEKFESLISNVQKQNQKVSKLILPTTSSSGAMVDCSSTTHTSSSAVEERSMKEQVKRSILGDDSYYIYRKILKPNRQ